MERTVEIIEKELEQAHDEYDEHFRKAPRDPIMNFQELDEYMKPYSEKCSRLSRELRMKMEPEFEEIPDYGDVFTLEDFLDNVKCGGFIDYDERCQILPFIRVI